MGKMGKKTTAKYRVVNNGVIAGEDGKPIEVDPQNAQWICDTLNGIHRPQSVASHAPTARTDDVILKAEEFRRSVNPLKIARELDAPTADHNEVAEEIAGIFNGLLSEQNDYSRYLSLPQTCKDNISAILARHYGGEGK